MTALQQRIIHDAVYNLRLSQFRNEGSEILFPREDPELLETEMKEAKEKQRVLTTTVNALSSKNDRDEDEEENLRYAEAELREIEAKLDARLNENEINLAHRRMEEYNEKTKNLEGEWKEAARRYADDIIPQSLTVSGMGITGAFFIELTAIITIIFGIIILGLFGVLGTEEISPILAAIAGYVLGKTAGAQGPREPLPIDHTEVRTRSQRSQSG